MRLKLTPNHISTQILIFLGVIGLFSIIGARFLLLPEWHKLENLQRNLVQLNQQWQKQQTSWSHHQQLQRDLTILRYSYSARLQSLHKKLSSTELYAQINSLAKSHGLQILELKPQKHQLISGLQQQIFSLNLAGTETNILSFLHLLLHQPWLLEMQQINLISLQAGEGIQLQAMMAAYHD